MGNPEKQPSKFRIFMDNMKALREAQEERQEKASAEFDRKTWNRFRKTRAGKAWIRFRNRLKKTPGGRKVLWGIQLSFALVPLIGLLSAWPLLGMWMDSWGGHVQLTDAQVAAGYYEGCSGSKHCSPDGAGYREMTPAEKASDANCMPNADDCISVIPLRLECQYVTVVINEYKNKGDWVEAERLFLKEYPKGSTNWKRGKPFTFSITGLNHKYAEWSIDQVRCDY